MVFAPISLAFSVSFSRGLPVAPDTAETCAMACSKDAPALTAVVASAPAVPATAVSIAVILPPKPDSLPPMFCTVLPKSLNFLVRRSMEDSACCIALVNLDALPVMVAESV